MPYYSRLFTFLAARAFCVFDICKPVKILLCGGNTGLGNGVICPLSITATLNYAAVAEYLHMVRERRLRDIHILQKLARTFLAAFQHLQYLNAVFIAERFEDNSGAFVVDLHLLHLTFTNIYFILYVYIEKSQYINYTNIYIYFC